MTDLLTASSLDAFYGDFQALFGVDFRIAEGESVALIGANGAGKSTFLKVLTGLLPVPGQSLTFDGTDLTQHPAHEIAQLGSLRSLSERRSIEEKIRNTVQQHITIIIYHDHNVKYRDLLRSNLLKGDQHDSSPQHNSKIEDV